MKKLIPLLVLFGLVPAVLLFPIQGSTWAVAWLGGVTLVGAFVVTRSRGLLAHLLFGLATLAFLVFSGLSLNLARKLEFDLGTLVIGGIVYLFLVLSLIYMASIFTFVSQGCSRRHAFLYLLLWMMGLNGAYREVKDGKVSEVKRRGPFVKPNTSEMVVIHSDQVVVFEHEGEISRIEGPGTVFTKPFETIRKVIVTQQRFEKTTLEDTFTKDGIPVKINLSVIFRLAPDPVREIELGKPYPFSREAVLKATYNTSDWEAAIPKAARSLLRDKIAQHYLDSIYDPSHPDTFPLGKIKKEVKESLQQIADNWGAVIISLGISRIEVPERVERRMLETWKAGWERKELVDKIKMEKQAASIKAKTEKIKGEAELIRAQSEVKAMRLREEEKARAKSELFEKVLQMTQKYMGRVDPHLALRFLQTLLISEERPRIISPYARPMLGMTSALTEDELLANLVAVAQEGGIELVPAEEEVKQVQGGKSRSEEQPEGMATEEEENEG